MEDLFTLKSEYLPSGDQPKAIKSLVNNINAGLTDMVLLGVTGSGKTFVMANVISKIKRPALIISHNKTLAGQLYQEFRDFFPHNAVEYFVSYYDYYQPESYIPSSDTYIEKEAQKNDEIDRLRLSTTASLSTRRDVIVVSSVSCIYNLGSPVEYGKNILEVIEGMHLRRKDLFLKLADLQYERNDYDLKRASYRVTGENIDIYLSYKKQILRLSFLEETLTDIYLIDPVTGDIISKLKSFILYPAKHYVTAEALKEQGLKRIEEDLQKRIKELKAENKIVEAYRLEQRVNNDIDMIRELGYTNGIENYSIYFDGRKPGDPPFTLMDYFPKDYLLIIDESHITIPQIRGMYAGDRSRKQTLVDYGFRLPSALDNRPLNFQEFLRRKGQNTIYTSATPSEYELNVSKIASQKAGLKNNGVVELIVRPTGLIDPEIEVRPTKGQVQDLLKRVEKTISNGQRVLITTLTKRMAEELSSYMESKGFKVAYLHSDIETLDRSDILNDLRLGNYDVLVGINLLREGLDLPEVSLVVILDADKEGFLRSDKSLIQTMGRAARHSAGKVILYADKMTGSMQRAIDEVERRRKIQLAYNKKHKVTPKSIIKPLRKDIIERDKKTKKEKALETMLSQKTLVSDAIKMDKLEFKTLPKGEKKKFLTALKAEMEDLAHSLEFEKAAIIRDKLKEFKRLTKN